LGSMFGAIHGGTPLLTTLAMIKVDVIIPVMLVIHWLLRNTRVLDLAYRLPWWLTGLVWGSMVVLLIISQESSSSFIYFQF
jgi:alginate O-acetyltransferase complex protein AlgI